MRTMFIGSLIVFGMECWGNVAPKSVDPTILFGVMMLGIGVILGGLFDGLFRERGRP